MDPNYENFRRLNEQRNRDAKLARDREMERSRDRSDAERRHRETLAVRSRSQSNPQISVTGPPINVSLKSVIFLVAAALLFSALAAVFGTPNRDDRDSTSTSDQSLGPGSSEQLAAQSEEPFAMETESDAEKAQAPTAPSKIMDENSSSSETLLSAEDLRGPTLRALNSGEAVRWQGDTQGYVTVSELRRVGEKDCRSVLYRDDIAVRTPPTIVWCRQAGQDWAPVS